MLTLNETVFHSQELASLEWHTISVASVLERLSVSPPAGLDDSQVVRRRTTYGLNKITPSPSNAFKKIMEWIFGGFGSLLLVASLVCFIAWYESEHSLYLFNSFLCQETSRKSTRGF